MCTVSIDGENWLLNKSLTYAGTRAQGLLMNVRMANAIFEDTGNPDFDSEANAESFNRLIPDYVKAGIRAFTICLQGGMPGYEGAVNSAYAPDGSLKEAYMARAEKVIRAAAAQGSAIILGCLYQRQSGRLESEAAVRTAIAGVAEWVREREFSNVVLEVANEYSHPGYMHELIRSDEGIIELMDIARENHPGLLVSASLQGHRPMSDKVCQASDFILFHLNQIALANIPDEIARRRCFGKPVICNEDAKIGEEGAEAAKMCVRNHCSWGLMLAAINQHLPFQFNGFDDDPQVYQAIRDLTSI